jgi:hypothetical protein
MLFSFSASALEKKTFCVWDPVGRTGPVMSFYSDLIPKAQSWGLSINFVPYTDEKVAANEFKAGKCDAVLLSAIMSRQFVKFGGTMDAVGSVQSEQGLELLLATLARPRAGALMTQGPFEVVATFTVGSMFAFVRDRNVDSIEDFAGKRMSILNNDPQALMFAELAGATPVGTTLSTFGAMFNNGNLDILLMPALAYNTFELYQGLGDNGGIINYPLYYGLLHTVSRKANFPKDFGHKMRNYMLTRLDAMNKAVADAETEIPSKYWINVSQFTKDEIDRFSKRVRVALKDKNINHSSALKLLWKIRCRLDRTRAECSPQDVEAR